MPSTNPKNPCKNTGVRSVTYVGQFLEQTVNSMHCNSWCSKDFKGFLLVSEVRSWESILWFTDVRLKMLCATLPATAKLHQYNCTVCTADYADRRALQLFRSPIHLALFSNHLWALRKIFIPDTQNPVPILNIACVWQEIFSVFSHFARTP